MVIIPVNMPVTALNTALFRVRVNIRRGSGKPVDGQRTGRVTGLGSGNNKFWSLDFNGIVNAFKINWPFGYQNKKCRKLCHVHPNPCECCHTEHETGPGTDESKGGIVTKAGVGHKEREVKECEPVVSWQSVCVITLSSLSAGTMFWFRNAMSLLPWCLHFSNEETFHFTEIIDFWRHSFLSVTTGRHYWYRVEILVMQAHNGNSTGWEYH